MKLHLGCGKRHIPGFIHVDALPSPHIDIVASVEKLPIRSESANLIYASHVLEHFGRYEFLDVLGEWYRILRPGGVLRVAVPDFAACASIYYERGLEDGLSGVVGLIAGGQRDCYDFHKMIFDEPLLSHALSQTGFHSIHQWDWRSTEHSDIDDFSQAYLPHLSKSSGRLMSLNLEASK